MERAATSPPPPDVAIRALRAADADALHALARQPSIDGRFASAPHASLDRRREWLEAQLYADDFVALAFHRRFGFEIEATQRGAALRGGVLVDGCLIARMKAPLPLAAAPGGTPT